MAVDPRQILGAFLTLTMFAMLANMIKKDHFDSTEVRLPEASDVQFQVMKVTEQGIGTLPSFSEGPWKEAGRELKPCWNRPGSKEAEQATGFITFSLSNGPGYHVSQVADAVVVAKYLGATLVLPDIRGSKPGDKRNFQEVYDVEIFFKSLDGVIKIAREYPSEKAGELAVVRVPNRVTEDYISEYIEPIFRTNGNLRIASFYPSVNMKMREQQKKDLDSVACLAMFGTLELHPEIHAVADSMVERLRTLSHKSDGQFIAVDLRVDLLEKKGCKGIGGTTERKSCYGPQEIGEFLRQVGFDSDTTIYLTQSPWHESLDALKEIFPKSYTKESIMPADKKDKFLNAKSSEFEKAVDFYICSQSDVFVPAISGLFYANVAGKRIASGRTYILVPAQASSSSASASGSISAYVSRKNHLAYSCFCE